MRYFYMNLYNKYLIISMMYAICMVGRIIGGSSHVVVAASSTWKHRGV
ncbi:hypothetical protein PPL_04418 [Heterostelium album PN500]|uniref:Uncharacterized protein n=1 Tax=Heterostelium pallidum (strain ATCC 26659 / Pp 5 / PN500) TaxID=670386 RepID=D3B7I0_HETP5|nr:hypothetical protein PPL_04418 [Heterostelium album PN500]EFA82723.1 hypothetical protein PPL_04418 [Heterostelium album PN500]|eukprot:XP_020434840.1 hypothetical protein PPL_04418 [Heterostelium album PN500]